MSPNAMALTMLSMAGHGAAPTCISRRFVADLSFDTINFIEFEWFSDGKLCLTMHAIDLDGVYRSESFLLDAVPGDDIHFKALDKVDLLTDRRPWPKRFIMRTSVEEHPPCDICYASAHVCTCPPQMRGRSQKRTYTSPNNWETWLAALMATRNGRTAATVKYALCTQSGTVASKEIMLLDQGFEMGVRTNAPRGNELLAMFFHRTGMLVSHPCTDSSVRTSEEHMQRMQIIEEQHMQNEWGTHTPLVVNSDNQQALSSFSSDYSFALEYSGASNSSMYTDAHSLLPPSRSKDSVIPELPEWPCTTPTFGMHPAQEVYNSVHENTIDPMQVQKEQEASPKWKARRIATAQSYTTDAAAASSLSPPYRQQPQQTQSQPSAWTMSHPMQVEQAAQAAHIVNQPKQGGYITSDTSPRGINLSQGALRNIAAVQSPASTQTVGQVNASISHSVSNSVSHSVSSPVRPLATSSTSPGVSALRTPHSPPTVEHSSVTGATTSLLSRGVSKSKSKKAIAKRRLKGRDKVIVCECLKVFNHRGHYNEHRQCVHEKVKQHKCAFVGCNR